MSAGELTTKTDKIKINTFLNAVGEEAIEVFDTFTLTEEQSNSYDEVIKAFENFCKPKKNTVYERFNFYQRRQKDGEPFDTFLMDIKRLARSCEFGDRENEMLRDQIVMSVQDKKVQLRLLEMSDLTYDKAVEKARQSEATREQVDTMSGSKTTEVNEIRKANDKRNRNATNHVDARNNNNTKEKHNRHSSTSGNSRDKNAHTHRRPNGNRSKSNNDDGFENSRCKYCNYSHKFGTKFCPAYGKKCKSCSKENHFSTVCRLKNVSTLSQCNESDDYDFDDNEEFVIDILSRETRGTDDACSYPWIEQMRIENMNVQFKIDTGAGIDVLPMSVLKKIAPQVRLQQTSISLRAFAREKIKPIGTCSLNCLFHDLSLKVKFAVVEFDCTPILGLKTCIRFNIIRPSRTRIFRNSVQNRKL